MLGNHLLEDGFSLLFGAFYFKDDKFYTRASEILKSELSEQILDDGGHFELSPMYHQIILDRLLDCVNLVQNNNRFSDQESLLGYMLDKARKMLAWLNDITFSNNNIPLFNDSTTGIAPTTQQLNKYSSELNIVIKADNFQLSSSGYRSFKTSNYECIVDIGEIGPSYQPGHAHADTFNFVLNILDKPFIIDIGTSTYEANEVRLFERGTSTHNTVTVLDKNSSQVWSSFRVGQRAKVKILRDEKMYIAARHNGYRNLKTTHQREWKFEIDMIEITDSLKGKFTFGTAHLWFASELMPLMKGNKVIFREAEFTFSNAQAINIIQTKIPDGYNRFTDSFKIEIGFKAHLSTVINVKQL